MASSIFDFLFSAFALDAFPPEMLWVLLAALFAGFIDSIVGGGGLILTPALFSAFPQAAPATLFGTNKSASIWGTAFAAWRYQKQVIIPWRALWPALLAALTGSLCGAWLVTWISPQFLRKALPFILAAVLIYTVAKKDMGAQHTPHHDKGAEMLLLALIGFSIGLYDGFFGPGTGSFFVFLLVRVMGYDFLNASVCAKLLNVATNLSAIALFASKGHVWWHYMPLLALANVAGSFFGTRLALKHGAALVRGVFIVVVLALILKTGYDAFGFRFAYKSTFK